MSEPAAFCQWPGDLDGCRKALIEAWREGRLDQHCILAGLRIYLAQCREIVLAGLQKGRKPAKSAAGGSAGSDDPDVSLGAACEKAVLIGYREGIAAAGQIFYEAYHRMVRYAAFKMGFVEETVPSADDVVQDAFLGLHRFLQRGGTIDEGRLRAFVYRAPSGRPYTFANSRPTMPPSP